MGLIRAAVAPGRTLRVGRTQLADFLVPWDDSLSQEHWELSWDGLVCRVRDLGSATGTFVGGERKDQADLPRGGWIRAGKTDFLVSLEHVDPEPAAGSSFSAEALEESSPERVARLEYVLSYLRDAAQQTSLFAVLDAARSDRIIGLLKTSVDDYVSLWDGLKSETQADGAPYLVSLRPHGRLLPRLLGQGWGKSFGVYFTSGASLAEVRAHLRRLLIVTREADNVPMYFRFYDPRVLRSFLPIATRRQKDMIFGPIRRFFAEGPEGDGVLAWEQG